MSEVPKKEEKKGGAPAWLTTFSDLMSLLLCFFVLLVSMSEIRIKKFREIAASLKQAFSGQVFVELTQHNSIIAPPFTTTTKTAKSNTESTSEDPKDGDGEARSSGEEDDDAVKKQQRQQDDQQMTPQDSLQKQQQAETEKQFKEMTDKLVFDMKEEIESGKIVVEKYSDRTLIRFPADVTFASGSADLTSSILPVLRMIGNTLENSQTHLVVGGHTDSLPINNFRFRSNWDLSSARAATVAQEIIKSGNLSHSRFEVIGYADGKPLASNRTPADRALNRRVEITILMDGALDRIQKPADGESPLIILSGNQKKADE